MKIGDVLENLTQNAEATIVSIHLPNSDRAMAEVPFDHIGPVVVGVEDGDGVYYLMLSYTEGQPTN